MTPNPHRLFFLHEGDRANELSRKSLSSTLISNDIRVQSELPETRPTIPRARESYTAGRVKRMMWMSFTHGSCLMPPTHMLAHHRGFRDDPHRATSNTNTYIEQQPEPEPPSNLNHIPAVANPSAGRVCGLGWMQVQVQVAVRCVCWRCLSPGVGRLCPPPVMCEHARGWHQATPMFSSTYVSSEIAQTDCR